MVSYRRFNYRAYPDKGQRQALACLYGACRFAYNWYLNRCETLHERHGRKPSYVQSSADFTMLKREPGMEWLGTVSAIPMQQALRHADTAYRNFFRRFAKGDRKAGHPRFKSKRNAGQSAEFTKSARFKVEHTPGCKWAFLTLPKIGRVKIRWTRNMPANPTSVTIARHADQSYEASFVVPMPAGIKTDAPKPKHAACGIDMGLESLMSCAYSDGTREKIPPARTLRQAERKLRKLDRQLARKQKGSNNRRKACVRRAKAYKRVHDRRKDMAFKLAYKMAGENQAVALETLNVKALARTRLGKSILDAGWSELTGRIIQLAQQWNRTVVFVDPWYPSSQVCSQCGRRDGRKPLGVRVWQCPACGAWLDRDWNAALNIMDAAGLAESLNACGGDARRRLAQASRNADACETGTH